MCRFIYGGHNDSLVNGNRGNSPDEESSQLNYNVVYILSLPAFVWFKVNDTSGPAKYGHTCEHVGHGQMVSFGGHNPHDNLFASQNITDPFPQGLGIFNMNNLSWTNTYDATAPEYTAPPAVQEWYSRP